MTEPASKEVAPSNQVVELRELRKLEAHAVAPLEARLRSESNPATRKALKDEIESIRKEYRAKRMKGDFAAAIRSHDLRKATDTYSSARKTSKFLIIGVAAALVVAGATGYFFHHNAQLIKDGSNANQFKNIAIMNYVASGVVAYHTVFGKWPDFLWEVAAPPRDQPLLLDRPADGTFRDAWGNPIIYFPFDQKLGFGKILSLGKDNRMGGEGYDADLEARFNTSGIVSVQ
jgi:hypothetical protein